jgi:anti-anti-sigma factor
MTPLARIAVERWEHVTVVAVRGEIDVSNGEAVQAGILDAVTFETSCLVLDLSDVAYFDSVGVRLAFEVEQRLGSHGIRLRIVRPAESYVRKVLDLCGADRLIPTFEDRATAIAGR